ncbi:MAG: hypothetical protein DMG72_24410 [Acidobacteria bacterium]|nr:MAG: hypothetical protein DMG72_24410 [Acidobacteriota bacterium]
MGTVSPVRAQISSTKKLGIAWVQLCLALAAHVTDEALTGFLSVYNPTVLALQAKLGFWLMPTFEFREWLTGLIVAVLLLLALSPFVFRGARWIRPLFYFLSMLMFANGLGHTTGTLLGHTVSSVRFPRPLPGFYSSPFLLTASVYALVQLRRTRHNTGESR